MAAIWLRPTCSRSRSRPRARVRGTTTSWWRPRRATRRSARWPAATARSSRPDHQPGTRLGRETTMITIFGIPGPLLFGQLLLGLINGAFYAMLSLGLAVIFGMLNIINFAHGALFMMGAFASWMLLNYAGIGYFPALILAPLIIGVFGIVLERL